MHTKFQVNLTKIEGVTNIFVIYLLYYRRGGWRPPERSKWMVGAQRTPALCRSKKEGRRVAETSCIYIKYYQNILINETYRIYKQIMQLNEIEKLYVWNLQVNNKNNKQINLKSIAWKSDSWNGSFRSFKTDIKAVLDS